MGGFGSTRWRWQSTKWCVEDCDCLDIDKLIAAGLLQHDRGFIECLKREDKTTLMSFTLTPSGDPKYLYLYLFFAGGPSGQKVTCEPIPIEMRPQRIGKRYFFRCHLLCASRVRKLYRPTARDTWGCRRCHKLTYRSCQQHDKVKERTQLLVQRRAQYTVRSRRHYSRIETLATGCQPTRKITVNDERFRRNTNSAAPASALPPRMPVR